MGSTPYFKTANVTQNAVVSGISQGIDRYVVITVDVTVYRKWKNFECTVVLADIRCIHVYTSHIDQSFCR